MTDAVGLRTVSVNVADRLLVELETGRELVGRANGRLVCVLDLDRAVELVDGLVRFGPHLEGKDAIALGHGRLAEQAVLRLGRVPPRQHHVEQVHGHKCVERQLVTQRLGEGGEHVGVQIVEEFERRVPQVLVERQLGAAQTRAPVHVDARLNARSLAAYLVGEQAARLGHGMFAH